jgi:hypothetical protein
MVTIFPPAMFRTEDGRPSDCHTKGAAGQLAPQPLHSGFRRAVARPLSAAPARGVGLCLPSSWAGCREIRCIWTACSRSAARDVGTDLVFGSLLALAQDDPGHDRLALALVGHPGHACLVHSGVKRDHLLYLARPHLN